MKQMKTISAAVTLSLATIRELVCLPCRWYVGFVCVTLLGSLAVTYADENEPQSRPGNLRLGPLGIRLLDACGTSDWYAIHQELRADQSDIVRALVLLAGSREQTVEAAICRFEAIRTLGEYRAAHAAPVLVRQVDFARPIGDGDGGRTHPLHIYPAAGALIQIGLPSIDAIIARLSHDATDRELKLFAWVIQRIDGQEIGIFRLRHFVETEKCSQSHRRQMSRLIEVLEATDFDDPFQVPPPTGNATEFPMPP